MAAELRSSKENSSLSLNITQTGDGNYNWCTDDPTATIIFSVISAICFIVGFPVTLWDLHELLQRQRQRSTSDIFMLSLAIVNLTSIALTPFCVCNFIIWHIKELQNGLFYSLSLSARPLFMACICWDCYMAVVYPIVYKTSKKLIVVKKAMTGIIWFTTVVAGFIMCTATWLVTSPFITFPLIIALPVISFCDISILRALRKPDPTGNTNIHPQKKQALNTISNSFIMTFIVYLPPAIIFLFGKLMKLSAIEQFCYLTTYGVCFSTVGSVIMPVLYLNRIGKLDVLKNWWTRQST